MSRSRDLANLAGDATGLETLTVSDITDLTATATELNYSDGVGSAIQTQINAKAPTASPTFTGTVSGVTPAHLGLGVTDILSSIVTESGITADTTNNKAYLFHNFVFLNLFYVVANPSGSINCATIASTYRPECDYYSNTISYQEDSANAIIIYSSTGIVQANGVNVPSGSDTNFRININMWYRI